MSDLSHFTESGLPGIGLVPYGMHKCHFYRGREELVATLVPYFVAGLKANERCLWIAAPPLPADDAVAVMHEAHDRTEEAIRTGQLRILDFDQWYHTASDGAGPGVVQFWLKEEESALAAGYAGLRVTGNTRFLQPADLPAFIDYERAVTAAFSSRRIVALCSYAHLQCTDVQMSDVMNAHHCTLERPDALWQVVPAA